MANQTPAVTLFDTNDAAWGVATNPIYTALSDGTNPIGTLSNPIRIDPTGTTHQPVDQGTPGSEASPWWVTHTDGTHAMPTGDANSRAIFQKLTDGTNNLTVNADGSINVVVDGSPANIFKVDFYQAAVSAKTYFELIQASNESTDFKHTAGTKIRLHKLIATALKSKNSDQWNVEMGVVLATTLTNVKIGWLLPGTIRIHDTGTFQASLNEDFQSDVLDLTVSAGDLTKIAVGHVETTTDLTNASTIDDFKGSAVTPVAGDLIMRVNPVSATGSLLVQHHLSYEVQA